MIANKIVLTSLLVATVGFLCPQMAHADDEMATIKAAPAFYGVKEFLIQYGRIANQTASANCGTSSGEIAAMVLKSFKAEGLPSLPVLNATPVKPGVARVDVFPDIVTLQPRDKECVSWISLAVQTKDTLRVYPIETPRNLITTYWSGGLMVSSSQSGHPTAVNEAVTKLATALSRQYRLDQPPALTPPDTPK